MEWLIKSMLKLSKIEAKVIDFNKEKVNVKVPGGELRIEIEGNSIYMIGDANFICDGIVY